MRSTPTHLNPDCPALTVEDLGAGYNGARKAVEGISFSVMPGEQIGVLGPNGAGKSTLFKAIVGLIPHHTGHISMHGEDCATSHKLVGYVPQYEEIDWRFPVTVRDVVMMGRVRRIGWLKWPRKHDWDAVDALLERVSMIRFRDRQIGQLSGGQKRRVFIARALAQETDVLLLDEPFSGVDAAAEAEIMEMLDLLRHAHVTVIVATHDLSMAAQTFDRLLLLNRRLIAYGTAAEVFTPETLSGAYGGRIGIFENEGRTLVIADEHDHGSEHDPHGEHEHV
ncbi:MAG: metal ABC transporter ATP-binding protein [Anaerolineae bacterium]|nr:metal ABC transporter ATP-binding protein [Anaerolineae bacterium]